MHTTKFLSAITAVGLFATTTLANTISFSGTPSGGSGAVDVSAIFTTGANSLTVQLINNTVNPVSVTQLISGLGFSFSSSTTTGSLLSSSSGTEVSVTSNLAGGYTVGATGSTGWALSTPTSSSIFLTVLGAPAGPSHLIIGAPNGSNAYAAANGSINGNNAHNPFLQSGATFTITGLTGVTAQTNVASAQFFFGTTQNTVFTPPPSNTPGVPDGGATAALLGLALVGLGLAQRTWGKN